MMIRDSGLLFFWPPSRA